MAAKKLGMDMQTLGQIADSLLNFASSNIIYTAVLYNIIYLKVVVVIGIPYKFILHDKYVKKHR